MEENHAAHHHSEQERRAVMNRISRAAGHLEAIRRMVEQDQDCTEILTQLAAVKSAINSTGIAVMKNHMRHCVVHAVEDGDMETVEDMLLAIERFMRTK